MDTFLFRKHTKSYIKTTIQTFIVFQHLLRGQVYHKANNLMQNEMPYQHTNL